ncbi:hypothetical protein HYW53_00010 [Candidatus Giovannonibacteria bacterium]|nr:hypothetical protein [Candidatus Giovannonibacteria bacterium]
MPNELLLDGRVFLTLKEASRQSGYHSDYLGRLARGGKLASERVGLQWFIEKSSLESFLGKSIATEIKSTYGMPPESVNAANQATLNDIRNDARTVDGLPRFVGRSFFNTDVKKPIPHKYFVLVSILLVFFSYTFFGSRLLNSDLDLPSLLVPIKSYQALRSSNMALTLGGFFSNIGNNADKVIDGAKSLFAFLTNPDVGIEYDRNQPAPSAKNKKSSPSQNQIQNLRPLLSSEAEVLETQIYLVRSDLENLKKLGYQIEGGKTIETIFRETVSGLSGADLDLRLANLNADIQNDLGEIRRQLAADFNSIALTQRINNLGTITVQSCSGCGSSSSGGGGSGTVNSGTAGFLAFYSSSGTAVDDTSGLFWDETNDLFGIGSTTPAQKLSVSGSGYFTGGLGVGVSTSTAGSIELSDKIYIGNTLFAAGTATSTFTGGLSVNHLSVTKALSVLGGGTSTFANGIQISNGCFRLPNGDCAGTGSGSGGWTDQGTEVELSTVGDLVLIGTTSPISSAELTIEATSTSAIPLAIRRFPGSTKNLFEIISEDTTSHSLLARFDSEGNLYLPDLYASSTIQATGNILGYGSLGIGTTSPAQELSIAGDGYLTGGLGIGVTTTTAGAIETSGKAYFGDTFSAIGTGTSTIPNGDFAVGTTDFVVTKNGRVGIGTAAPKAVLDITTGQVLVPNGSATVPGLAFSGTDGSNDGFYQPANDRISIVLGGTERARWISNTLTYNTDVRIGFGADISSSPTVYLSRGLTGNADTLNLLGGYIGIGTTSPWGTLSLEQQAGQ